MYLWERDIFEYFFKNTNRDFLKPLLAFLVINIFYLYLISLCTEISG